ncbi:unnamed protein product [Rhizophagus irregularis]|nr:unnamed protein product [Rhizophagus irregularis]
MGKSQLEQQRIHQIDTFILDEFIINTIHHYVSTLRRFDVSSIPQYDYGYDRALQLFKNYKSKPAVVIEDVTNSRATTNTRFVIFKQDQAIINDPNVFLRRTPPPDDKSISTIGDNSYVSAAETVATIDYPPTPAREL